MACLRTSTYSLLALGMLLGCPSKSTDGETDATATDTTATTTNTTADQPTSTDTAATDTAATDTAATDTAATDTAATDTAATTLGPLEPSGPNPCGSCAPGEYCNEVPTDDEDCGVTACSKVAGSAGCEECMAAPGECEPQELANCVATICWDETDLLGYSIADDGVLVVRCEIFADTGCGG